MKNFVKVAAILLGSVAVLALLNILLIGFVLQQQDCPEAAPEIWGGKEYLKRNYPYYKEYFETVERQDLIESTETQRRAR